jgi:hypothetical protein
MKACPLGFCQFVPAPDFPTFTSAALAAPWYIALCSSKFSFGSLLHLRPSSLARTSGGRAEDDLGGRGLM